MDHDGLDALMDDPLFQPYAAAESVRRLSPEEQAAQLNAAAIKEDAERRGVTFNYGRHGPPLPPKKPKPLDVYSASTLYGARLERTPMFVPDMLPAGLTVLAGAPKRGKSWLALNLGIAVASGGEFLDRRARQADVLYLDLESRQYRVQDRLSKILVGAAPERLYITHDAAPLGNGLYDQIGEWVDAGHPSPLIIIDTLGRINGGGKRNKGENAYEADTRVFGELQKWAFDRRCAVMVVHHLRKVKDGDDWFDRISGSAGLTGVADAVWGLGGKRGDPVARLQMSGRDLEDAPTEGYAIRMDHGRWSMEAQTGEDYEEQQAFNNSPTVRGVYRMMQLMPEWQGGAADLREAIVAATGDCCEDTAKDIERALEKHMRRLYDQYQILVSQKKIAGGRRVWWLRNRATGQQSMNLKEESHEDEANVANAASGDGSDEQRGTRG